MSRFNTFYERRFLTGVDLEKDASFLLKFAAALAKRSHMLPRFVHVEKTIVASKLTELWTKNLKVKSAFQAFEAEKALLKEQELRKLILDTVGKEWETACYLGDPGESLLLDTDASESRFIVLGFSPRNHDSWALRFSVLFKILSQSDVPVFIIPEGFDSNNWLEKRLRFLVADDLNESDSHLVDTAFRLAASLENTEISHVHVNPLSKARLESTMSSSLDPSFLLDNQAINTGEIYALIQRNLEKQMQNRAMPYVQWAAQADVAYHFKVEVGDPREEIAAQIADGKPDLVVFGRHHMIHAHPFYVGHIPFQTMIHGNVPTLIVP